MLYYQTNKKATMNISILSQILALPIYFSFFPLFQHVSAINLDAWAKFGKTHGWMPSEDDEDGNTATTSKHISVYASFN